MKKSDQKRHKIVEKAVEMILKAYNININDEHFVETPKRVAKMYDEIFSGLLTNEPDLKIFTVNNSNNHYEEEDEQYNTVMSSVFDRPIVLVKDIKLFSVCAHHLLPFYGIAHVAYIPSNHILGLSKIARIVDYYARRPQIQEILTEQILNALKAINPLGIYVYLECEHLCTAMRGIQKSGSKMITSALYGVFETNQSAREEVLLLVK